MLILHFFFSLMDQLNVRDQQEVLLCDLHETCLISVPNYYFGLKPYGTDMDFACLLYELVQGMCKLISCLRQQLSSRAVTHALAPLSG